jgi:small basic protein
MSNMALYLIGSCLVIAGLAYAGVRVGIDPVWIGIGAVVILGLAVMSGVSSTRRREESPADDV